MKDREHKIDQALPFEKVPTYLRHLADALEHKTANLPAELADLPGTVSKLKLKGKARRNAWEFKLRIKTTPGPTPPPPKPTIASKTRKSDVPAEKPDLSYKALKTGMKTSFKKIGASLNARVLPDADTFNAFLADAEMMMAFGGEAYGETYYPQFREACRRLSEAYASQDVDAVKSCYAAVGRLKAICHKAVK